MALNFLCSEIITYEVCFSAVEVNGEALQFVPNNLKTYEICLTAVRNYSLSLIFVPKNIQTEVVILDEEKHSYDAVRQYGGAIEYIPEQSLTYEICIEAVKN